MSSRKISAYFLRPCQTLCVRMCACVHASVHVKMWASVCTCTSLLIHGGVRVQDVRARCKCAGASGGGRGGWRRVWRWRCKLSCDCPRSKIWLDGMTRPFTLQHEALKHTSPHLFFIFLPSLSLCLDLQAFISDWAFEMWCSLLQSATHITPSYVLINPLLCLWFLSGYDLPQITCSGPICLHIQYFSLCS